ncbi:MAG: hypothetical protein QXP27_04850 [Candidatus Methanomethyliaceae archaeon]
MEVLRAKGMDETETEAQTFKTYRVKRRRDRTTLMLQVLQELCLRSPSELYSRRGLLGKLNAKFEELESAVRELKDLSLVKLVFLEDQDGRRVKGLTLNEDAVDIVRKSLPLLHRVASRM